MNQNSYQPVNASLIVPYGLEPSIFPWGANLIANYVTQIDSEIPLTVEVLDLSKNQSLLDIQKENQDLIDKLRSLLKPDASAVFAGNSPYHHVFGGAIAFLGSDFARIAIQKNMVKNRKGVQVFRKRSTDLDLFKNAFLMRLKKILKEHDEERDSGINIWGLSVYDFTLFNSLSIARILRDLYPASSIVFGGDRFSFAEAIELIRTKSWIDGVVVGHGEESFRQIVSAIGRGDSISNLQVKAFVNARYLSGSQHTVPVSENFASRSHRDSHSTVLKNLNTPPYFSDEMVAKSLCRIVRRQPDTNTIRVLSQRGCSYGKCTFCNLLDRGLFFRFPPQFIVDQLKDVLDSENFTLDPGAGDRIEIECDSDETSPDLILAILDFLAHDEQLPEIPINCSFWFQVKSFNRNFAEQLHAKMKAVNVKAFMAANLESLNPGTLKNMRKGHSPIQAIECAKILQDIGCFWTTNYFLYFPLENPETVAAETGMLEKVLHLILHERGNFSPILYSANSRDLIFENQEKFKIKVKLNPMDVWNKEVFGVNLPMTFWINYKIRPLLSWNHDQLLNRAYYGVVDNFGSQKMLLPFMMIMILRLFGRSSSYWQRGSIFRYLMKMNYSKPPFEFFKPIEREFSPVVRNKIYPCTFIIRNSVLYRDYWTPKGSDRFHVSLSNDELAVLRFLYWRRKRNTVFERFAGQIGEEKIDNICTRHKKLGSILEYRSQLLAIPHDPEYWNDPRKWD